MAKSKQKSNGTTAATCQHHWKIGTPNGSVSRGTCRHCGASREFPTGWQPGMMRRQSAARKT